MSLGNTGRAIPIPGVVEVSSYVHRTFVPFSRPESYITWKDNQLTRGSGSAWYHIDFEDEVWLNKFNIENGFNNPISADAFELIISSFEKSLMGGQDNHVDVKAARDGCISLESSNVLDALHSYWIKKRKQKQKCLDQVNVFECYQPRRTGGMTKAVLRKKRIVKGQASKNGRAKRRNLLDAKGDTVDIQKNILELREAGAPLKRLDDLAVTKRQRAQLLMEVADESTYGA